MAGVADATHYMCILLNAVVGRGSDISDDSLAVGCVPRGQGIIPYKLGVPRVRGCWWLLMPAIWVKCTA